MRAAFSGASGANSEVQVASSPAEATSSPPFLISEVTLNESPRVVLRIRVCASSSESVTDFDSTTTFLRSDYPASCPIFSIRRSTRRDSIPPAQSKPDLKRRLQACLGVRTSTRRKSLNQGEALQEQLGKRLPPRREEGISLEAQKGGS